MKTVAVVFEDVNQVRVGEVEMPPPQAGQVTVRTLYSTVSCGTEGWVLQNVFTWQPTHYPCVPGYQRVGVIEQIGPGVEGWAIGQKVMATAGRWEGPVCPLWGSHVGLANTPANELYALSEDVDEVDASAAVVAQVGYNAASRITGAPGQWVAVFGDGLIGQCAAQAARARGMHAIIVGHRASRLRLAEAHSADAVIDSHEEDLAAAVARITGSRQVAAVIDTVQGTKVQAQYVDLLANGSGQIVYSGFSSTETWADMADLQKRELTAHFVSGWTRPRMQATLDLMAEGKMRVRPLVTHLVSYRRAADMWQAILSKQADLLGVTFEWQGDEA